MEDFKNFLSIGHLSDTDVKSFMWEPKKKFQDENPGQRVSHATPHEPTTPAAHHGWDQRSSMSQGHPDDHHGHHDHHEHSVAEHEGRRGSGQYDNPLAPPDSKAPGKRRPVHGLHHGATRSSFSGVEEAEPHQASASKT